MYECCIVSMLCVIRKLNFADVDTSKGSTVYSITTGKYSLKSNKSCGRSLCDRNSRNFGDLLISLGLTTCADKI